MKKKFIIYNLCTKLFYSEYGYNENIYRAKLFDSKKEAKNILLELPEEYSTIMKIYTY